MRGIIDAEVLSEPMQLPLGQSALTSMIILREKSDGTLKSRFVAKGCSQTHGVNYDNDQLYAPVASRISTRLLFAIAASLCCHIHTLDVNRAFLYGTLNEDVYILPPPGFTFGTDSRGKRLVCKLLKSLYGLKNAPAVWRNVIHTFILSLGFSVLDTDKCVYFRRVASTIFFLAVHVDDILIISNDVIAMKNSRLRWRIAFESKIKALLTAASF